MAAASYKSFETLIMPERNRMAVYPRFCHTHMKMIVGRAHFRSEMNTGGFLMPKDRSRLRIGPLLENKASHTAEIATILTI